MLETVKNSINNIPDIPFSVFYGNYIMKVQDDNIEEELRFLEIANTLDVRSFGKLIENSFEKMVKRYG